MVLQPDTRSVSPQVISRLRIIAALVAVVIAALVVLGLIPVHRIAAYYWRWRHGTSIKVGGHRFPVPKQWQVNYLSPDDFLLLDLNTGDTISVRMSWRPGLTLAAWEAWLRSMPDAKTIMGRKELQVGGETILCVEKNLDTKAARLDSIECRSESALEVTFAPNATADRNQMFYALLQQVQKL